MSWRESRDDLAAAAGGAEYVEHLATNRYFDRSFERPAACPPAIAILPAARWFERCRRRPACPCHDTGICDLRT